MRGKTVLVNVVLSAGLLSGCQAVDTTSGGAVAVDRKQYMFSMLSTDEVNQMYAQSYQETLSTAADEGKLVEGSALSRRIEGIARRLIAQAPVFRADAANWSWDVNVIDSEEMNANCGPGGKIIFYSGLVNKLELSDAEIAAVMGHEIAHALREHGREAMSKAYGVEMATQLGTVMGLGVGVDVANLGVNYLMTLPNSRTNEKEADVIGLELAARAGYDPRAAITLWQKMNAANESRPPEFMSTHPSPENRIAGLQQIMPQVLPLYEQARRQ